jgi:uncharacterized protein (TIGR03083 family)
VPDIWTTIADERGGLADDLAGLTASQWETRSLCTQWSIRELVAHMSTTASMTPPKFFLGMAQAGFNFDKFANNGVAKHLGPDATATLNQFRGLRDSTSAPPGPKISWLGEAVVHGEDVRRPLGISHTYPSDVVRQVIDFYKGSNLIVGSKKRVAGLALSATDDDWQHGTGDPAAMVEGPLLSLLLAMTGRGAACDDLNGPGVPILLSRC